MTEETEFETYLSITPNKFGIYVFDTKNSNNLYDEEFKLQSNNQNLNDKFLIKFLEKNIFKIEKLTGKFIKNIYLLIDSKNILNLSIGIKKKIIAILLTTNIYKIFSQMRRTFLMRITKIIKLCI